MLILVEYTDGWQNKGFSVLREHSQGNPQGENVSRQNLFQCYEILGQICRGVQINNIENTKNIEQY